MYNEYYPFGLQTSNSWTREEASNRYLYNGGNELNENSGWYETFFRGYDAALGKFMQVDPLASTFSSHSPYHFAYNNPVRFSDVLGASPVDSADPFEGKRSTSYIEKQERVGPFSPGHWTENYETIESFIMQINHMPHGGTWSREEGSTTFRSPQNVRSFIGDHLYWNKYGGEAITRKQWLELIGPSGKNKFADYIFQGNGSLKSAHWAPSKVFRVLSLSEVQIYYQRAFQAQAKLFGKV